MWYLPGRHCIRRPVARCYAPKAHIGLRDSEMARLHEALRLAQQDCLVQGTEAIDRALSGAWHSRVRSHEMIPGLLSPPQDVAISGRPAIPVVDALPGLSAVGEWP